MLLSWDRPVVQRTAFQMSTMGTADKRNQQRILDECRRFHRVSDHVDCTEAAMAKRLLKLYPYDAEDTAAATAAAVDNDAAATDNSTAV